MDPIEAQKSIYDALTSALPGVPIYDDIPQDEDPLYIVIGDDEQLPDDTKDRYGVEHQIQIDVWSSYAGFKEVKQTIASIYDALHRQALTVAGHDAQALQFVRSDYMNDPEGFRHGVIIFRFQTQPE